MRRGMSRLLLVSCLAVVMAAGCARRQPAINTEALNDAVVTTRVKTALINDPTVGDAPIDVRTVKGAVTLTGRVPSKDLEARAVELARGAQGVGSVTSSLEIQP